MTHQTKSPEHKRTVQVLLFGSAAKAARLSAVSVTLSNGNTVADLLTALAHQHPAIANEIGVGRIAINHAFVSPATTITGNEELALISMVSGG